MFNSVPKTSAGRHLNIVWVILMVLTLLAALIAERADPSLAITIVISIVVIIKAQLVIDYFMELTEANKYIYYAMCLYFYLFPLLTIVVWVFPETIAYWTSLDRL